MVRSIDPGPVKRGAPLPRWQGSVVGGSLLGAGDGRRTLRDWIVDLAMVVGALAGGAFVLVSTSGDHSGLGLAADILLGTLACLSLFWRRRRPFAVALFAVVLAAVSALASIAPLPAVFNAAIRLPIRKLAPVVLLAVASTAVLPLLYPRVGDHGYGWQVTVGVLLTAVAVGWGLFVRVQRDLLLGLRERAEDGAREAERRRIAREMHDVLAHRLTIVGVHAGALEGAGDRVPSEYREAAGVVRDGARLALQELRAVIGILREDEPEPATAPPQPTLERVAELVEESRAAGLEVAFESDLPGPVPAIAGRTAYRAIQEGLTNARKHGGDRLDLRLRTVDERDLLVELISHGPDPAGEPAAPPPVGTGTGLVGLRERVELAGGEVEHGPDADGAFVLRARIPLRP